MKKGTFIVLTALLVLSMVFMSCGEPPLTTYTFKLGETHADGYPTTMGDLRFAELVEKYTEGRFKVVVEANAKLGEEKVAIEQVQLGAGVVDMTRVSLSVFSSFVPETDVLQLPYLYRGQDHMWNVLHSPIGAEMFEAAKKANFVGLCWMESGSRNFYTRTLVTKVADLKGMKIRVQQAPVMVDLVTNVGAVATPLPFGEVYQALKTGVVDGAENNWPSYLSQSHFEGAPFFIEDGHTRVPEILVVSKRLFDRIPANDQAAILKAAKETEAYQIDQWNQYEKKAKDEIMTKPGITVTIPAPEVQADFQKAMQPMYDKQSPAAQAMIKKIQEIK
ncbi:MAG: TRAP transporter substrate-binding protein [Spirochaetales bacterium]|nr:TRAP transporter substrate-binding protein [Spirochaetales bacterium]